MASIIFGFAFLILVVVLGHFIGDDLAFVFLTVMVGISLWEVAALKVELSDKP